MQYLQERAMIRRYQRGNQNPKNRQHNGQKKKYKQRSIKLMIE